MNLPPEFGGCTKSDQDVEREALAALDGSYGTIVVSRDSKTGEIILPQDHFVAPSDFSPLESMFSGHAKGISLNDSYFQTQIQKANLTERHRSLNSTNYFGHDDAPSGAEDEM